MVRVAVSSVSAYRCPPEMRGRLGRRALTLICLTALETVGGPGMPGLFRVVQMLLYLLGLFVLNGWAKPYSL
jgi:hypothetical protein